MLLLLGFLISALGMNLLVVFFSDMGWVSLAFYPLFLVLSVLVFLIFCGIVTLCIPRDYRGIPKSFMTKTTYIAAKFILLVCNIKVVVKNKELLDGCKNYLFVSNHQSNFDPIIQIAGLKEHRLTYIMKKNIMSVPIIGNWLYASGHLPLDRDNNRSAVITIKQATARITDGSIIGAYPEGTRSKSKEVGEFKDGLFKVALKSEGPIVVCAIDNAYKAAKRTPFIRTKVLLKVCRVIEYDEYKDLNTHEIGDMVKGIIIDNLQEERKKIEWLK